MTGGEDIAMSNQKSGSRSGNAPPRDAAGDGETHRPDAIPDAAELSKQMAEIAEKSQRIVTDFLSRQDGKDGIGMANPMSIGAAFFEMTAPMMSAPAALVHAAPAPFAQVMTRCAAHGQ